MKISNKAYELVRNKYLAIGTVTLDETDIGFRETVIENKDKVITIYEDNCEGGDYVYIRIFIEKNNNEDDIELEEYEVRA